MRTISTALATHLATDVHTLATLILVVRKDGKTFGFTDHDVPIVFGGVKYDVPNSASTSAIDMTGDMSTSNMEIIALLDSGSVTQTDLEAGLWDGAAVTMSLCNFNDLTQGAVVLMSGTTGQTKVMNGLYQTEFRSLSQMMQQQYGEVSSPSCRASLGDARCKVALGPLTATGSVGSVNSSVSWNDASLTQVGPNVGYTDTRGHTIPTTFPYTIQVVPPTGGAFVSTGVVHDNTGAVYTQGTPAPGVFSVSPTGLYTFDISTAGGEIFISYTYSIGYFAYGKVTFTSGLNSGYSFEVKSFSPGVVSLRLPTPFALAVGDTYTIVAGCDRQFGTCKTRFNNVVNFRGEPYVPGNDTILRPQTS